MKKNDNLYLTHLVSGMGGANCRRPSLRGYHIFHCITRGSGYLQLEDRKFPVTEGQTFYIPPDTPVSYWSEESEPWEYVWVNFSGEQANELLSHTAFSAQSPICTTADSPLPLYHAMRNCEHNVAGICLANGLLMQLLSFYINAYPSNHLLRAEYNDRPLLSFVRNNLYRPELSVDFIAKSLGISRVTLYRRFLAETGTSPTEYIKHHRLIRASQLVTYTELPISKIAYSVGYNDPLYFTKLFHSFFGKNPTQYRKDTRETP